MLSQIKSQDGSLGIRNGSFGDKDGFARPVAASRAGVDAPGRLRFIVEGKLDRPRYAARGALVVEDRFQGGFRQRDVRRRGGDLYRLGLLLFRAVGVGLFGVGRIQRGGFHFEFRQRGGSVNRPARPAAGEIGIGQQFQPECRDALDIGLGDQLGAVLGGGVALREKGAVLHQQ